MIIIDINNIRLSDAKIHFVWECNILSEHLSVCFHYVLGDGFVLII